MDLESLFNDIKTTINEFVGAVDFTTLDDENPTGDMLEALEYGYSELGETITLSLKRIRKIYEMLENGDIEIREFDMYLLVANVVALFNKEYGNAHDPYVFKFVSSKEFEKLFDEADMLALYGVGNSEYIEVTRNLLEEIGNKTLEELVDSEPLDKLLTFALNTNEYDFSDEQLLNFEKMVCEKDPNAWVDLADMYTRGNHKVKVPYHEILAHLNVLERLISTDEGVYDDRLDTIYLSLLDYGSFEGDRDTELLYNECVRFALKSKNLFARYKLAEFYARGLYVKEDKSLAIEILKEVVINCDNPTEFGIVKYRALSLMGELLCDDKKDNLYGPYIIMCSNEIIRLVINRYGENSEEMHYLDKNNRLLSKYNKAELETFKEKLLEECLIDNHLDSSKAIGKDFIVTFGNFRELATLKYINFDDGVRLPRLVFELCSNVPFSVIKNSFEVSWNNLPGEVKTPKKLGKCKLLDQLEGFKTVTKMSEAIKLFATNHVIRGSQFVFLKTKRADFSYDKEKGLFVLDMTILFQEEVGGDDRYLLREYHVETTKNFIIHELENVDEDYYECEFKDDAIRLSVRFGNKLINIQVDHLAYKDTLVY